MLKIFSFLLILYCVSFSFSQEGTLHRGEVTKCKPHNEYNVLFANEKFYIESEIVHSDYLKPYMNLHKIDCNTSKVLASKKLILKWNWKEHFVLDVFSFDGQIMVQTYSSDNYSRTTWYHELNPENFSLSDPDKIAEYSYPKQRAYNMLTNEERYFSSGLFSLIQSPSKKYLLAISDGFEAENKNDYNFDNRTLELNIFEGNFEDKAIKRIKLDQENFYIIQSAITNEGVVYLMGVTRNLYEFFTIPTSFQDENNLQFIKYDLATDQVEKKIIDEDERQIYREMKMLLDDQGIYLASISTDYEGSTSSVRYKSFDLDLNETSEEIVDFEEGFVKSMNFDFERKAWNQTYKNLYGSIPKTMVLVNVYMALCSQFTNGDVVYVMEKKSSFPRGETNPVSQYGGGILIYIFNKNGLKWSTIIPKKQLSITRYEIGVFSFIYENQLHLFYNENLDELKGDISSGSMRYKVPARSENIRHIIFDSEGNELLSRSIDYQYKGKNALLLRQDECQKIADGIVKIQTRVSSRTQRINYILSD